MFATSRTTSVVTDVLTSLIDAGLVRQRRITAAALRNSTVDLELLWSQLFVLEIDETLMRLAGDLATTHGMRGYDAVHLAAAHLVRADVFSSADDNQCPGRGSNPHSPHGEGGFKPPVSASSTTRARASN